MVVVVGEFKLIFKATHFACFYGNGVMVIGKGNGGYEIVYSDNEDMGTNTGDVEHERQVVESWVHETSGGEAHEKSGREEVTPAKS